MYSKVDNIFKPQLLFMDYYGLHVGDTSVLYCMTNLNENVLQRHPNEIPIDSNLRCYDYLHVNWVCLRVTTGKSIL